MLEPLVDDVWWWYWRADAHEESSGEGEVVRVVRFRSQLLLVVRVVSEVRVVVLLLLEELATVWW